MPKHVRQLAYEITRYTLRDHPLPYAIASRFGLSTDKGRAIYDLAPRASGPGGEGEDWMAQRVGKIIMKRPS